LPATSNIAEVIVFNDPISNQPITSQTLCQNATPTALTIVGTGGMAHLVINGTAIHQILILEVSQ
jgi:mannose/fructose/N-acetylgalactosamine-specific phosphotransferase system component IIB